MDNKLTQEKISSMNPPAYPCQRCGVCCCRHQAFVTAEEIDRICAYLGITHAQWDALYDDPRWKYTEYRLIRHVSGACAFLSYQNELATCLIHAVKPACCAAWQPSPERAECREGSQRRGKARIEAQSL